MYIDTHAHLTMPEFKDLEPFLSRAREAKIEAIINASFDIGSSRAGIKLADQYDFIYAAPGIHPHDADQATDAALDEIREMAKNKKVVAIGETGLDYYRDIKPREVQQKAFRDFLRLAQEVNKPVIIHCRDAQEDTIRIIKEENKGRLRGVFHCFAGDETLINFAKEIGFYISYTGTITFKKAQAARDNVLKTPVEKLLLETDCPYLAPEPHRGKVNEPSFIPFIAKMIADIKGLPISEIARITTDNARELFGI